MNWFDFILIGVVIIVSWRCFWLGFIKSAGSLIGIIIGVAIASHFYERLFSFIGFAFGNLNNIGKVVCFFLLFAIFSKLVYLIFVALDKAYDFLSIIPFLGPINNLAGGILGVIIGIFICALLVYISARYFSLESSAGNLLVTSKLSPYFIFFIKLLGPVISGSLKNLKSIL